MSPYKESEWGKEEVKTLLNEYKVGLHYEKQYILEYK